MNYCYNQQWATSNGATETRQDGIRHLFVLSQNSNTQKYWICVVSLSWDNTHVLSLEIKTSILYCLRWLIPPQTSLIHKILAVLKKKKQRHFIFIFFICKSKSKTMDFLTNQGNTDTGIRLKIKTIHSNTNTCLVSVALLPQVAANNGNQH
jgi:hypothetical protein